MFIYSEIKNLLLFPFQRLEILWKMYWKWREELAAKKAAEASALMATGQSPPPEEPNWFQRWFWLPVKHAFQKQGISIVWAILAFVAIYYGDAQLRMFTVALTVGLIWIGVEITNLSKIEKGKTNKWVIDAKEGAVIALVEGERPVKLLPTYKDHMYNPKTDTMDRKDGAIGNDAFLLFGRYFFLYPWVTVYEYKMAWQEWKLVKKDTSSNEAAAGSMALHVREEMTQFVFLIPFPYGMLLYEAEDSNKLRVNMKFTVLVECVHPYKTMFEIKHWDVILQTLCIGQARNFVGANEFNSLLTEKEKGVATAENKEKFSKSFSKHMLTMNDNISGLEEQDGNVISKNLPEVTGLRIVTAKIDDLIVGGDEAKRIIEAQIDAYVKTEEGKAKVLEAGFNRDASNIAAEATFYNMIKNGLATTRYGTVIKDGKEVKELIVDALVVDAVTKAFTDSLKEWGKTQTLIVGQGVIPPVFNVNQAGAVNNLTPTKSK